MILVIGQRWKFSDKQHYYVVELTRVDDEINGVVKQVCDRTSKYNCPFYVGEIIEDLDIDPEGPATQVFWRNYDGLASWEYMIGQDTP